MLGMPRGRATLTRVGSPVSNETSNRNRHRLCRCRGSGGARRDCDLAPPAAISHAPAGGEGRCAGASGCPMIVAMLSPRDMNPDPRSRCETEREWLGWVERAGVRSPATHSPTAPRGIPQVRHEWVAGRWRSGREPAQSATPRPQTVCRRFESSRGIGNQEPGFQPYGLVIGS
jgi:hypothetical protein